MRNCAVWMRVSTGDQNTQNQEREILAFCDAHGLTIVRRFVVHDSAWQNGSGGSEYRAALAGALDGAWRGEYGVLVVWSLDRLTRLGIEATLRTLREFADRDCVVLSIHEPWLNGSDAVVGLLRSVWAWMAEAESARRSERTRAGLERARASGVRLGRPPGAQDKKPRRRRSAAA